MSSLLAKQIREAFLSRGYPLGHLNYQQSTPPHIYYYFISLFCHSHALCLKNLFSLISENQSLSVKISVPVSLFPSFPRSSLGRHQGIKSLALALCLKNLFSLISENQSLSVKISVPVLCYQLSTINQPPPTALFSVFLCAYSVDSVVRLFSCSYFNNIILLVSENPSACIL